MSDDVDISQPPQFSVSITFFGETQNTATRSIWHSELGYETYGTPVSRCLESVFEDNAVFAHAARNVAAATVLHMGHGVLEDDFEEAPKPNPNCGEHALAEHAAWVNLVKAAQDYCMLLRQQDGK